MPLAPGTRFGPYEIVAPLGAGGMGEVYRARDTRLGRDVAVKVLPQHLSANPEIRARFEREAKTVSSLNHPHICALYDVGRAPGEAGSGETDYLVMELVEGETLAARLARGALPAAEVLKVGAQIADALDRAHRAGVVHRDLKPGNVMITRSGAKLMDFGLARATGLAGPGSASGATLAMSQSPTVAQPLTAEGTIIGTFQYMAPEQLEGQEADARADLWALGCVLYEMATGRRAFDGRSQASLIGAIMHSTPPPPSQISTLAPPALDRLVSACLAKDPADRVQSAHDVKLQLQWMAEGAASVSGAPAPALAAGWRGRPWPVLAGVAVVAAAAAALATWAALRGGAREIQPAQRYVVGSADLQNTSGPALSPDGSYLIFSVREGQSRRLYRRGLASFEMTPIPGTEEGQAPFFSPDGAWIGFSTPNAMKKVPAAGGVAQAIVSEERMDASDWGRDGMIYFTPRAGGSDGSTALARVPETGGRIEVMARLDTTAGDREAWLPEIMPDGKTVLITISGRAGWRIVALRPGGERHLVTENAMLGRYVPAGYLLYFDFASQAVLAAPFDAAAAKITGPAVPLTEQVDPNFCFDVAPDGKLVYVPLPGSGQGKDLVWVASDRRPTPVMDARGPWTQPRISPDGGRIIVRKTGTQCELWMYDLGRGSFARVAHGSDFHSPIWGPDGRWIAFRREDSGGSMSVMRLDGAREERLLARGDDSGDPQSWSAGGNLLAFTKLGRGTRSDIWVIPMDGAAEASPFLATSHNETDPSIHPDGRWIAYTSGETGTAEVFVRRYPDTGETWQISAGGGGSALWSRDGRALYFMSGRKLMRAGIESTPSFRAGVPAPVLEDGVSAERGRDFDVAADGRVLTVQAPGGSAQLTELRVLLNWEHELERLKTPGH